MDRSLHNLLLMFIINKNDPSPDQYGEDPNVSKSQLPVALVLIDCGDEPEAVADILQAFMNLTLRNPQALGDALPLTLFESLPLKKAEQIQWHMDTAGATVELRVPRERFQGLRRPSSARRAA